jgi:ABC-2 type transport system permease protein
MRFALLIALKDIRQRIRNRSAILITIVAPFGLAFIFSALLANTTSFHARYVVVDLDGGQLATVLRHDVIGALATAGVADVSDAATRDAAVALVTDGKADAAFVIPAGFSAAISAGRATTLEIAGGRNAALETEVARSVAQRFGDQVVLAELAVATAGQVAPGPLDAATTGKVIAAATAAQPSVTLVDDAAPLRQLDMATYFSASMAIMFLFFSAGVGIVSLFDERRAKTLDRILAGPVPAWSVLLGKELGAYLMGVLSLAVLVMASTVVMHADWGPPLGVALLGATAVLAAVGITTLVASFGRSAESAGAAASAVALTLGILGGSFTMSSQGPDAIATLSLLTPHGWFLRGLGDMHGVGASAADALLPATILFAMGGVTLVLGMLRARRLVEVR